MYNNLDSNIDIFGTENTFRRALNKYPSCSSCGL